MISRLINWVRSKTRPPEPVEEQPSRFSEAALETYLDNHDPDPQWSAEELIQIETSGLVGLVGHASDELPLFDMLMSGVIDHGTLSANLPEDDSPQYNMITHSYNGEMSFNNDIHNNEFRIYGNDSPPEPILSINLDTGKVTLGVGYSTTYIAEEFWKVVTSTGESKITDLENETNRLREEIRQRCDQVNELQKEIDYLRMKNTVVPDEPDERFTTISEEL